MGLRRGVPVASRGGGGVVPLLAKSATPVVAFAVDALTQLFAEQAWN